MIRLQRAWSTFTAGRRSDPDKVNPALIAAVVCLWVPAVAFGIGTLFRYTSTPGQAAAPAAAFPAEAPVRPARGTANLVMFLHPQCPCSRATLGELALIMARQRQRLRTTVYFYLPAGEKAAWAHTDLWDSAVRIPGVSAVEDRGGAASRTFGAFTSGQALLYDARGRLAFSGGITAFRGHSGDNAGRDAILALLNGENPSGRRTAVFGCSLRGAQ